MGVDVSWNQTRVTGQLLSVPQLSWTPARVPIVQFWLEHRSRAEEAGQERDVFCRIPVYVVGEALSYQAQALGAGEAVEIVGFLSQPRSRRKPPPLELHAQSLRSLVPSPDP